MRIEFLTQHSSVNDFVVINIPEDDVESKQIIFDPDDQPMWKSAKTIAPTPSSVIIQLDIDDNFVVNTTHLNMIRENKFDGYLWTDPHDHIREFLAICDMFIYGETESEAAMDSQIISLKEELEDMYSKYYDLRDNHASKNHLNDDTPMCEHHEANYIQSKGNKDRNSHDSYSHQSHHDPNDSEKSLIELNNDVRNDLEDFKRRIHSMRTVHWKFFARDDGKTIGVLPNKETKTVNQEPQSKTDLEKSITKFLDGQRVSNMFVKNNVNEVIIKIEKNKNNFQIIFKNMERKIDEWSKSQNVSSKQTNWTEPPPPLQAHTEHVNVVFTVSEKFDDPLKTQKDPPLSILVKNKTKKDKPIKTSKKGYDVVKTNEYPF
nr:reverse transcriptase domain-containing protein [Tanacetum cinerariifolium]